MREILQHQEKEERQSSYRARKIEREDTVCSEVHNMVSREVISKIHTRKRESSLCDSQVIPPPH